MTAPHPLHGAIGNGGGVLVLGSANLDLILRVHKLPVSGETVVGHETLLLPGGKGLNQAIAAAVGGAHVTMVANTGNDANADIIWRALREAQVDVAHLRRRDSVPTGMAVVMVTPDGENAIVVAAGANDAFDIAQLSVLRLPAHRSAVLLMQMEIPEQVIREAVLTAREMGMYVILNLAPAVDLDHAVLDCIDVLVVNIPEAEFLLRGRGHEGAGPEVTATALLSLGPSAVVLTAGGQGAYLAVPGKVTHVPALRVEVVDTTGAGDAFVGVLAAAVSRGRPLLTALELASRAGAEAVQVRGAQLPRQVAGYLDVANERHGS